MTLCADAGSCDELSFVPALFYDVVQDVPALIDGRCSAKEPWLRPHRMANYMIGDTGSVVQYCEAYRGFIV